MTEDDIYDTEPISEELDELMEKTLDRYFNELNTTCLEKPMTECIKYKDCFDCKKGIKLYD